MIPMHKDEEMSTAPHEALGRFEITKEQDLMSKRFALVAIRLMVSVNLLYAAIFAKFAGNPTVGRALRADVASGSRVDTSAGISARIRGVRNHGSSSVPDSEDSRIGGEVGHCVDDYHNSQSHLRVGIWCILCRRSRVDGARYHIFLADTQALALGRTRKRRDDGYVTNAQ